MLTISDFIIFNAWCFDSVINIICSGLGWILRMWVWPQSDLLWSWPWPKVVCPWCRPLTWSHCRQVVLVCNLHHHHHHHVRVAGEGRCVTPVPWPRRMADLHNVEGMLPVSLRIWSTHLLFGRPGRRFQSRPGRRPSDRSTWARRAWWAGTSYGQPVVISLSSHASNGALTADGPFLSPARLCGIRTLA